MRIPTLFLFAATLSAQFLSAAPQPPPFAHVQSDIPVDPDVRWGTMENGVRYAVLRHAEPPGRLSMRLHVAAGSLHEEENQRGLAHFLEHMAFNGTKNFKADELVNLLQNAGIAFGADLNAYTSFDETVYMLDLPKNDAGLVDKCLTVIRDWADGMLLEEAQINKERGVILSEKRDRDSVEMRLMEEQFKAILPDALVTERFPIGTEEVISKAPRDRFVDFYQKHYSPDRISVVVVGDFEPDAMVETVKKFFSSMKPLPEREKEPSLGKVTKTGLAFKVFQDNEVKATEVDITSVKPYESKPDTKAERARHLPLALANAMLNRRLEILAKKENSPIVKASASSSDFLDFIRFSGMNATAVDGRWEEALALVEQELRRALEHGFNPSELAEANANLLRAHEEAVKSKSTRKANSLAMEIVSGLNDHEVFTTPETDLALFKEAMTGVTPAACAEALKEVWSGDDRFVSLTVKDPVPDGEKVLAKAWKDSLATKVEAEKDKGEAKFAYQEVGPAGTVAKRVVVDDLGITQLVLGNNVRVNLKRTDFAKNRIEILGRFGEGKLTLPKDKGGLDMVASVVMNGGGLEAHSVDDLERIFAGKKVGVQFSVEDDAFTLSGSTTPEDLALQLKLFCAAIQHPGYRPEAERQLRNMLPMLGMQMTTTAEGVFGSKGQRMLMGGDTRFGMEDLQEIARHDTAAVKAWVAPSLADAALDVSIVGDFDPAAIEPMILSTLGALPTRKDEIPGHEESRLVPTLAVGPHRIEYQSKVPKSLNLVFWPTADRTDIKRTRRLNILGEVLGDRLRVKIREEMGEAYSPSAGAQASDTWKDFGYIICYSPGDPAKSAEVTGHIIQIARELAEKGATDEELGRAVKPILSSIQEQKRSNAYWLETVLSRSQRKPEVLDWAREMEKDYQAITTAEISKLAAEYLGPERARTITITTPVKAENAGEGEKPKEEAKPAKEAA